MGRGNAMIRKSVTAAGATDQGEAEATGRTPLRGSHPLRLGMACLVTALALLVAAAAGAAISLGDATCIAMAADPDAVVVTKYWDDDGYAERFRPRAVTLHLAREDAPGTEVSRVTLTESDAISDDAWQGVFPGVRKYDEQGSLIPYMVTEDVPEGYIASYDNGYSGYELTWADGAALASYQNVAVTLIQGGQPKTWGDLSQYLPYSLYERQESVTVPGSSSSYVIYPVDGSFTVDEHGPRPFYPQPLGWKERLFGQQNSILSRRYVIDVVGDEYPESIPSFPALSGYVWRYRHNLGRNAPELWMTLHNESWGMNGPPIPLLLAFSDIKPVRSPDKPLEVTDTINLRDLPFRKVWDDEGHENHRPQSVTLDVYQDGGTRPFKTVVVRSGSAVDDHTWESAFTDLPRYRDDYSEHEYTIVERPVPGYSGATYDSEYYNGVDLTFSTGTTIGTSTNMQMLDGAFHKRGMRPYVTSYTEWADGHSQQHMGTTLAGDTVSFAGKEGFFELAWTPREMPEQGVFEVASMRRVHIENIDVSLVTESYEIERFAELWDSLQAARHGESERYDVHDIVPGEAYLPERNPKSALWVHYRWDDSKPFPGADIVTNHVDLTVPRAEISKVDVTGEHEVVGATLSLSEKGGAVIDEWVSGSEPHSLGSDRLEFGKTYVLRETAAPDGYAYAADIEFVAGIRGGTDVVRMVDRPTRVEISKVAITGGAELPGASLRVTEEDGDVIDEWVSGTTPHVIEGVLVAGGTYVLHEETAPDGYGVASDIEFSVSMDGSIDRVEMVDEAVADGRRDDGGQSSDSDTASDARAVPTDAKVPGHGASDEGVPLLQTGDAVAALSAAVMLAGIAGWLLASARRRRVPRG